MATPLRPSASAANAPALALTWSADAVPLASSPCPGRHIQPVEQILFVFACPDRRMEAEEVGGREGAAAQVCGQADQEAVPWDLRAVGK